MRTATPIDELPDDVRAKVLKQIGVTTAAVNREALAQKVIDGIGVISVKLEELKPDIELLWLEFDKLADGETILGCSTKTEFCKQYLHRTLRAVRYMLAGGNVKPIVTPGEKLSPTDDVPPPRDESAINQHIQQVYERMEWFRDGDEVTRGSVPGSFHLTLRDLDDSKLREIRVMVSKW